MAKAKPPDRHQQRSWRQAWRRGHQMHHVAAAMRGSGFNTHGKAIAGLRHLVVRATAPLRGGGSPKKGGPAAQALGRSRGGFSTKIHVSVDGLGNPLRFILTGGQQHDITQAEELIAGYAGEHVLADQGYDAQEFRQHILDWV